MGLPDLSPATSASTVHRSRGFDRVTRDFPAPSLVDASVFRGPRASKVGRIADQDPLNAAFGAQLRRGSLTGAPGTNRAGGDPSRFSL